MAAVLDATRGDGDAVGDGSRGRCAGDRGTRRASARCHARPFPEQQRLFQRHQPARRSMHRQGSRGRSPRRRRRAPPAAQGCPPPRRRDFREAPDGRQRRSPGRASLRSLTSTQCVPQRSGRARSRWAVAFCAMVASAFGTAAFLVSPLGHTPPVLRATTAARAHASAAEHATAAFFTR